MGFQAENIMRGLEEKIIVISGGAAAAWDLFQPALIVQIFKSAYTEPASRVKLVRAECGD